MPATFFCELHDVTQMLKGTTQIHGPLFPPRLLQQKEMAYTNCSAACQLLLRFGPLMIQEEKPQPLLAEVSSYIPILLEPSHILRH